MNYFNQEIKCTLAVLKNSFKKHKFLFALLVILQITFLLTLFYILITSQIKIAENVQNITAPFQKANYDVNSLQSGQPFLTEMYFVYKAYQSLVANLVQMGLWLVGVFILLNGAIWLLSHYLSEPSKNEEKKAEFSLWNNRKMIGQQFLKFITSFFVLLGSFIIISYLLVKTFFHLNSLSEATTGLGSIGNLPLYMLIIFGVTYYLFLLAAAIINVYSWKQFGRKFLKLSVKKIFPVLSIAVINLLLLGISGYLIFLSFENINLQFWGSFFTFMFILMLILTRLFWINSLQEIAESPEI